MRKRSTRTTLLRVSCFLINDSQSRTRYLLPFHININKLICIYVYLCMDFNHVDWKQNDSSHTGLSPKSRDLCHYVTKLWGYIYIFFTPTHRLYHLVSFVRYILLLLFSVYEPHQSTVESRQVRTHARISEMD
uniref:Uncharacterized protein n=1 Tax=Glypta fumiferanae TaxID=389681 RepID=A0A0F6QAA6_9HYME|nr:hypothetical protein [Glypta fumiferanae]